jgi:hypothetical protein
VHWHRAPNRREQGLVKVNRYTSLLKVYYNQRDVFGAHDVDGQRGF